jgi:hypothetical protein
MFIHLGKNILQLSEFRWERIVILSNLHLYYNEAQYDAKLKKKTF